VPILVYDVGIVVLHLCLHGPSPRRPAAYFGRSESKLSNSLGG
jgi:hypothetical protein